MELCASGATELGGNAQGVAAKGGAIVGDAVQAMGRIEKASSDITEIVTVIDGTAFQTNAAVEAARAGGAGKGFAVVASEVRALAQRSSGAANDIKSLISNSTEQVTSGVKLVKDAGLALSQIVEGHMDELTQRNSSMAEQSAGITAALQDSTDALNDLVGAYRLGAGAQGVRPAAGHGWRRAAA